MLFGYNRDGKRRHEQMVIALVCNEEGCPVGVEVFSGNTQDASTVPQKIAQIQEDYGVKEILFVGDRGMMTQANARKVRGIEGLNTISALTHRQIVDLLGRKVITPELFDEKRILEVIDPEEPGRRYELCRNPWTAQRETTTRQNLLEVTRKALDRIAGAKRKSTQEKIGARVGRVLQKYKMGKFVNWEVQDGKLNRHFDEEKIAAELLLDGCYVITTDAKPDQMDSAKTVESYQRLATRGDGVSEFEDRPVGSAARLSQDRRSNPSARLSLRPGVLFTVAYEPKTPTSLRFRRSWQASGVDL